MDMQSKLALISLGFLCFALIRGYFCLQEM